MLAAQRRQRILDEIRRVGGVRVSELTSLLGVSDMTVRRDLERLGQEGLIQKVHGGATVPRFSSEEPGFEAKSVRELAEKHAIAEVAATLVQPGLSVALGAGTTTWLLAQHLDHVSGLTVTTNSVKIADALGARHHVVLTGGVRTPSDALVGPVADLVLRSLHFDVAFLGCHGMSTDGLSTPNMGEAATNRAFVRAASRVVLVADSTKWGTVGLMSFADLSDVDVLVTDSGLPADAQRLLRHRLETVHVVAPAGEQVAR